jgi:hypothetical protein
VKYLCRVLLVVSAFFGLGVISGLLEPSGDSADALQMEAALKNTARRSPSRGRFVYDYTCNGKTLASYDVEQDKVLDVEDLPPESPFALSFSELVAYGEAATGWGAATWVRSSIFTKTTEGVSTAREVGLFLGAATGFLAGRWFVLARALNCHQPQVVKRFKDELFWQSILRIKFQNNYDKAVFLSNRRTHYVLQHFGEIQRAIANCDNTDLARMGELGTFKFNALPMYRLSLNNAAKQITYFDIERFEEFAFLMKNVVANSGFQACFFGKPATASFSVLKIGPELVALGPLAKWLRILSVTCFVLFVIVLFVVLINFVRRTISRKNSSRLDRVSGT